MEKRKAVFPKGFFTKERPKVNLKDALKDIVPVEWISNISTPNDKKLTQPTISECNKRKNLITDNTGAEML